VFLLVICKTKVTSALVKSTIHRGRLVRQYCIFAIAVVIAAPYMHPQIEFAAIDRAAQHALKRKILLMVYSYWFGTTMTILLSTS